MINNFDYNEKNYVAVVKNLDKYIVYDGKRRLSILKYNGQKNIPVIIIDFMELSNRINLAEFFNDIEVGYCIIRHSDTFPGYYRGQDVDVLTNNIGYFADKIKKISSAGLEIKETVVNNHRTHIDLFYNSVFDLRFDITDTIEHPAKENYAAIVLSRVEGESFKLPYYIDEMIIRYIAYINDTSKERHLNYVRDNMNIDFLKELANVL
jgi:hypothetical protein